MVQTVVIYTNLQGFHSVNTTLKIQSANPVAVKLVRGTLISRAASAKHTSARRRRTIRTYNILSALPAPLPVEHFPAVRTHKILVVQNHGTTLLATLTAILEGHNRRFECGLRIGHCTFS
jgi:hypothetical protein